MKNIKTLLAFLVLAFIFTGCVSKDTKQLLSKYAIASSSAQENIMATYKDAINNKQKVLYYKAVKDGATVRELQTKKIDYSGQTKILADLMSFTDAMVIITGDSFDKKIDENSAKLYKSAKKLSENEAISQDISKKDLQIFATVVDGAMRGYSEHVRYKKLKELMLLSDKWVQVAIDSLDDDLKHWKKLIKRSVNKQIIIKIEILNNPYTYCQGKNKTKKCIPLADTFKTKVAMYEEVNLLQQRINNLDKEFDALSKSITAMSNLHKDVIASLKHKKIDMKLLKKKFNDLKEQVDSINKFRKTIKE